MTIIHLRIHLPQLSSMLQVRQWQQVPRTGVRRTQMGVCHNRTIAMPLKHLWVVRSTPNLHTGHKVILVKHRYSGLMHHKKTITPIFPVLRAQLVIRQIQDTPFQWQRRRI